jgi:hypothetical protein
VGTTTENLSCEGLFCISSKPFKIGERLLDTPIVLECHVTVERVEYYQSGFGLGCCIED